MTGVLSCGTELKPRKERSMREMMVSIWEKTRSSMPNMFLLTRLRRKMMMRTLRLKEMAEGHKDFRLEVNRGMLSKVIEFELEL